MYDFMKNEKANKRFNTRAFLRIKSAFSNNYYCTFTSEIQNKQYVITYRLIDNRRNVISRLYKAYFDFNGMPIKVESYRVNSINCIYEREINWNNIQENLKAHIIHELGSVINSRYTGIRCAKRDIISTLVFFGVFTVINTILILMTVFCMDELFNSLSSNGLSLIESLGFTSLIGGIYWAYSLLIKHTNGDCFKDFLTKKAELKGYSE